MAVQKLGYGEYQIIETATQEASYGELQLSQTGTNPNLHGSVFGTIDALTGEFAGWASIHGALSGNLGTIQSAVSLQGLVDAVVAQISGTIPAVGSGAFSGSVTGDGIIQGALPRMMVGSVAWSGRVTLALVGDMDGLIQGIRGVNYHGRMMGWMRGISGGVQVALTSYADELPKRPHKPGAVFLVHRNGRSRRLAKQPSENRLFQIDLDDLLTDDEVVEAVLSIASAPAGLSFSDQIISGYRVWYRISGGTNGQTYKITLKVRTSAHPVLEVDVQLAIIER